MCVLSERLVASEPLSVNLSYSVALTLVKLHFKSFCNITITGKNQYHGLLTHVGHWHISVHTISNSHLLIPPLKWKHGELWFTHGQTQVFQNSNFLLQSSNAVTNSQLFSLKWQTHISHWEDTVPYHVSTILVCLSCVLQVEMAVHENKELVQLATEITLQVLCPGTNTGSLVSQRKVWGPFPTSSHGILKVTKSQDWLKWSCAYLSKGFLSTTAFSCQENGR